MEKHTDTKSGNYPASRVTNLTLEDARTLLLASDKIEEHLVPLLLLPHTLRLVQDELERIEAGQGDVRLLHNCTELVRDAQEVVTDVVENCLRLLPTANIAGDRLQYDRSDIARS